MASYTDDEIKQHVQALVAKNAAPADIEAFVAAAKGVPVQGAPAPEAPSAKPPLETGLSFDAMRSRVGGQLERIAAPAADMGTVGGLSAAGGYLGTLAGPGAPVAVPVMSALGAGAGAVLNSMRKGQPISAGEAAGASVAGLFPGQSLANAGARQVAKSAVAQGLANTAAKTVETGIDRGTLPTVPESAASFAGGAVSAPLVKVMDKGMIQAQNAARFAELSTENQNIVRSVASGFKISPSKERNTLLNNIVESVSGGADTKRAAAIENVLVRDRLARQELGLAPGAEISLTTLRAKKTEAAAPYREIQDIADQATAKIKANRLTISDPHEFAVATNEPTRYKEQQELLIKAGADVGKLTEARRDAVNAYEAYKSNQGGGDHYKKWKDKEAEVDAIEANIQQTAKMLGGDLDKRLEAARTYIAKASAVERALNPADGHVSGLALANDRNVDKFTGNLKVIADFAGARPWINQDADKIPAVGVSNLIAGLSGASGIMYGVHSGDTLKGMAVAAAPFLGRQAARKIIMSGPYQSTFGAKYSGPNIPDYIARAGRGAVEEAGRSYGRK